MPGNGFRQLMEYDMEMVAVLGLRTPESPRRDILKLFKRATDTENEI